MLERLAARDPCLSSRKPATRVNGEVRSACAGFGADFGFWLAGDVAATAPTSKTGWKLGQSTDATFFSGAAPRRGKLRPQPPARRQPLLPSSPTSSTKVSKFPKSIISPPTELPTTINDCNSSTCDKN
jgi:hypothetical protein